MKERPNVKTKAITTQNACTLLAHLSVLEAFLLIIQRYKGSEVSIAAHSSFTSNKRLLAE
jgi:hypothetical protein